MNGREGYSALSIPEIINGIFENINWKSIQVVSQVCSQWYNVVKNNQRIKYKLKYHLEFGGPIRIPDEEEHAEEEYDKRLKVINMDWKSRYDALLAEIKEMKDQEKDTYRLNSCFTKWAIEEGHYNFLEKLIHEDNYNSEYFEGDPILLGLVQRNDTKTFKVLMKHYKRYFNDELFPKRSHKSLQHEATRLENFKFVKLLLDTGVDIDHYEGGETSPVLLALSDSTEEILLLFLEREADLEYVQVAFEFEELISYCASKLWAKAIIQFFEEERSTRADELMFAKYDKSLSRSNPEIDAINVDKRELLQCISKAIETMKKNQDLDRVESAVKILEDYSKKLEIEFEDMIKQYINTTTQ
eukprot:TRINITY_DN5900_c0_g1_i1.p1 TRINITY_DN5900_c0_g1~~TRINITY_DN5900_c0_g1_i1.p1  ORF type:complete len:357 (+),score=37.32 TRINITY_DN5900_c0_g1_i1:31-1101(+)